MLVPLQTDRCIHELPSAQCAMCTPPAIAFDPDVMQRMVVLETLQSTLLDCESCCPACDGWMPVGRRVYLVDGVWLGATCAEQMA